MNVVRPSSFPPASALIALGLKCALLLAVAGCGGHLAVRKETVISGSFPLPAGTTTVRIEVPEGDLTVRPGTTRELRFEGRVLRAANTNLVLDRLMEVDATLHQVSFTNGVLTVAASSLPKGLSSGEAKIAMRLLVELPADIAVDAEAGWGRLGVEERNASIRLKTGHGDIILRETKGDAWLRGCTAEKSRGGKIIVANHDGNLDLEGKGAMLQVYMSGLGDRELRVVSRAGPIQVHVPKDASFDLDLRVHEGSGVNAFGIERTGDLGPKGVIMKGRVGRGGPRVLLESEQKGNVSLSARAED